jgi:ankyrin repeat protein
MGIYDRDWYRDSSRGGGWFHDLHPVGKIMLFLLVGSMVTLFVMNRWGAARRHPMPADDDIEQLIREARRQQLGSTAHDAAERGDVGRLAELLAADPAQATAPMRKDVPDQPLHRAAWGDQRRAADILLRYGADVNARGDQGYTPLHYAARMGNTDVAELLLKQGADATLKDDRGRTPMDLAHDPTMQDLLRPHTARR